ncbi:MAG: hypothetical protein AAFY26_18745, partial [Cyanobacteria bacterium J06638_22]
KFQLFQRVRHGSRVGLINCIKWICPLDAIAQEMRGYGWFYQVSFLLNKQPEDYFTTPESDFEISEDEIFAIAEEEVASEHR